MAPIWRRATVLNDDRADWREAWALFPGDVAYVWHARSAVSRRLPASLEASGFAIRSQIIWDKTRLVIGRGDYHWQHEPCWYAVRKGSKGHWAGDRKQTTVWAIPHRKSETGHGTQKPVECMRRPIENNSSPGQAVYEPFCGSGTTIIAAEMTGRICHAIELDPAYVDVAIMRWQAFTGRAAMLEPLMVPKPARRSTTSSACDRRRPEMARPRHQPDACPAPPGGGHGRLRRARDRHCRADRASIPRRCANTIAANSTRATSRPTPRWPRTSSGRQPAKAASPSLPRSSG